MQYRSELEILLEMVEDAENRGLITTSEDLIGNLKEGKSTENQYVLDLATHGRVLSQLEDAVNEVLLDTDVMTATGEALDRLGRLVGVTRFSAEAPVVDVTVGVSLNADNEIVIPAGTACVIAPGVTDDWYGSYVTSEECVIHQDTTSASVRCVCTERGVHRPLPANAVIGLEGYSLNVSSSEGTSGRSIEGDDEYRLRVMSWPARYVVGTRACIEDYLGHYSGLDGWCLVPRYAGVGSLKIVCDTLESQLASISADVYRDCMLVSDLEPVCVLPETEGSTLASLELECHRSSSSGGVSGLSDDELTSLIVAQVYSFVEGGLNRAGVEQAGLGIGADFNPSQLVSYLLSNVSEVDNIVSSEVDVIPVPSTNIFRIEDVVVTLV